MMNKIRVYLVLFFLLGLLVSCTTNKVDFDTFSTGTTITNQYASEGFTFSSPNGPPHIMEQLGSGNSPSPPNTLCPSVVSGSTPPVIIDIDIDPSVCNVWLTTVGTATTIEAYDVSNNVLDTIQVPAGTNRTRVNKCNMKRVSITGTNFCIDDLESRDR